jgi:hypothetical protein
MNCRVAALLCAVSVTATGCFVPDDATARVQMGSEFGSKFVHRGMTQVDRPVLQPSMGVTLPTVTGDSVNVTARANMDLQNDNGDAWFPNGHAGRFSEIDFIATYSTQLTEDINVRAGLFNYNLPNGREFNLDGRGGPGEERGGTSEVFVIVSANVLEATPYFSWHYDFDEVRAAYYRAGITESFEINDKWSVVMDGSIGYATSAQSDWLYDLDQAGLADLRGFLKVNYAYDARTTISAAVHGSAMMNSTLDRWFNDVGVPDDDPIWFTLGVNWNF